MLSMELLKRTSNVKGEKNRFHSCTHICRQRICAPIWKNNLSHSRNWKMKRVTTFYVMPNRLLKTNWGQHCGCCMTLTQLISHTVRTKMVRYELLRERHTHTHTRVCKIIAIHTMGMGYSSTATNKPTNFLYLVSFCCRHFFSSSIQFFVLFRGRDGENWHARTRNGVRVCMIGLYICLKEHCIEYRIGCILVSDQATIKTKQPHTYSI